MKDSDLKSGIWNNYHKHGYVHPDTMAPLQRRYDRVFEHCYLPHMPDDHSARILEIGCNKGWFLMSLKKHGYVNLHAIDMAPREVDFARQYTGGESIREADAFEYLPEHGNAYDVIIMRAVLEHIEKRRLLELLQLIRQSLCRGGKVFIEVPNMDWLLSNHERYLDLSHENGFTTTSLKQLMEMVFDGVQTGPVQRHFGDRKLSRIRIRLLKPMVVFMLRKLFWVLGEGMNDVLFEYRSIIGIGRRDD